jgi:hypothetical protein
MCQIQNRKEETIMATKKPIWILIEMVVIVFWLLGSVKQAVAETKEFRIVSQFSKLDIMPVGDAEGHIFYNAELRGLSFEDGEVAVYVSWGQGELTKGIGPYDGYVKHIHQDGSTIVYKVQATMKVAPDGKTSLHEGGKGEITMGTGRFEGIKGSISYTGKRLTAISPGLKETRGDTIIEGTMTYTLPSK